MLTAPVPVWRTPLVMVPLKVNAAVVVPPPLKVIGLLPVNVTPVAVLSSETLLARVMEVLAARTTGRAAVLAPMVNRPVPNAVLLPRTTVKEVVVPPLLMVVLLLLLFALGRKSVAFVLVPVVV